jgi:hypothetical protein
MNQIYTVAAANFGKRLTLDPSVPREVGCAAAVSWILKRAGFYIPKGGITTVNSLIDWMLENGFEEVYVPVAGAVVTAHRPLRSDPAYAHAGICLNFGIGSNDSRTGKFEQNYTHKQWHRYFDEIHKSTTRYFYHK